MILISAGHHEAAQGAQFKGCTEWKEAVKWKDLIIETIGAHKSHGVPSGTLSEKVKFINERHPWMAVEIHFNAAVDSTGKNIGRGCETLYHPGSVKGKIIAEEVQGFLHQLFPPDRGAKEGWYKMDRPGQVDYPGDVDGDETIDYFLRKTSCPAVIIEPEFIHHTISYQHKRTHGCELIAAALLSAANKLDL
jgi:hypothetical protein